MAAAIYARQRVNLKGLERYKGIVASDLRGSTRGPVRQALRQWGARYRAYIQRRFVQYSRGGGNWPPLKYKRRRGSRARASILRDTGTLFAALSPFFANKPGQLEEDIPFGVKVGYGGPQSHPSSSRGVTVADIASFHQTGAGFLPKREIIVPPDQATIRLMENDMERALIDVDRLTD